MIHPDGTVEVAIDIAARPETVFPYFTDPARFSKWVLAAVELQAAEPGAALSIAFAQGKNVVAGRVVEVDEPRRIVFSWGLAPESPDAATLPAGSTTVTITVEPIATGSRVTLRHAGLVEALRGDHVGGWVYYLSQLAPAASAEHFADKIEPAVEALLAAWNERDADKRRALLAHALAENGVYHGAYGTVTGHDALDAHIAAAQRFMSGYTVVRVGDIRFAHGHTLHDWAIRGPQRVLHSRGTDVCERDLDGKIVRVLSFPAATDVTVNS